MTLKNYIFKQLWFQVVISLLIGLVVGLVLGDDVGVGLDDNTLDSLSAYLKIPANIFLSIILMIIVPLIFASIIVAITNLGTKEKMKTLGLGIGVYFVITTTISILIAITLASIIAPGSILDLTALQETHDLSEDDLKVTEGFSVDDIPEIASNIIPRNPIVSYLEGQMLSILIMAMIVGLAMAALPKDSVKPLLDLLESIQKITLYILIMAMKIVPFAVFGLIVGMVAKVGIETMAGLGVYMATVILGLGAMLLVYTMIIKFVAKRPISSTFSKFRNPQTLAFSTASSMATMPMTLKTAEEDLKLDTRVSKFVIPLGTTINMDGTALYQVIAVFFLAQLFAIELSMFSILVIIITSLLASIGTPAVPGAGTIVLTTILITVGIPPVGILLLLSVDRILDMIRTMVNVTGDLTASCAFDEITREKN
ncbi:Proton-sodium-glutamate symport protein [Marine Group I thaumarchaeote SCGC AAA799-E16]|uniref:Proton-sodium-glutamate symport protein n=4 Tax=Marine Group I TaxID=905826 RepID=A0A081RPD5_9ARCH|nr:Proton-sodium-glutamate symport protein [Marine Group I thaumarchaeote SCGC AAA799-N04]KER06572.1 Proton-sodium-glutamate symport protein [Marine Group I thaumarchaeote SCGC AAA799-E16]KFM16114.1 Proton-sodium-glutamate symport protein [Marine Group I thaumarchaeote SCGC AAA799-D11]KFM17851.1 Proton-sodium-glutamate symport protein [Marine Group I thaumarchaeote SCGC RSA3]